jgi:hypothetical protein
MRPTEKQIQTAAYFLWQRRGSRHGRDIEDWFAAEQDLLLSLNYLSISQALLDEPEKRYVGDGDDRWCRYCGRVEGQVTFWDEAHALPEAFGNHSLIAFDECDECNKFFSETIEDSFGKLFLPFRTILAISGKRGVPTHKDKGVRIDFDAKGNGFILKETGDHPIFTDDVERKKLGGQLTLQPYVPVRVLKCLAKMAIAIMPDEELPHFELTRKWLLEKDDKKGLNKIRGIGCYKYLLRVPYPHPWVALMRRRNDDTPLPYMMVLFGVSNLLLQAHVPMSPKDNVCAGRMITIPRVGSLVIPGIGEHRWASLSLPSAEIVRDMTLELVLSYQSRQRVETPA